MKITLISVLLLFSLTFSVRSQTQSICPSVTITGWSAPSGNYPPEHGYTSVTEAKQIINNIIAAIGVKQNFEVLPANIPNAAAIAYHGQRFILYNPVFIRNLNAAAGNDWAAVSVLAHEVGHHLNGHTLDYTGSDPARELQADEFSGYVLRRMGASLAEAQVAMKVAANYKSTLTHPGQQQRLLAIADGWYKANRQIAGKNDVAGSYGQHVKKPVAIATGGEDENIPNSGDSQNVLADEFILRDVHFAGINDAKYFITTHYHFVKVYNNQLYILGKLVPVLNSNYPYVIAGDNSNEQLFVSINGVIVTDDGTRVGYLAAHR